MHPLEAIDPLVKPWKNGLADLIVGEDALAPERLYHKLFRLTANKAPQLSRKVAFCARRTCTGQVASEKGWSREAMIRLSAAVDLACWDIVGKAWRLKWRGSNKHVLAGRQLGFRCTGSLA